MYKQRCLLSDATRINTTSCQTAKITYAVATRFVL